METDFGLKNVLYMHKIHYSHFLISQGVSLCGSRTKRQKELDFRN